MQSERIETTHVGSLVRPPELVEILEKKERGRSYDHVAYEVCLRESIAQVVSQQNEAGISIVSDGEFGKSVSWSRYVMERLSGFAQRDDVGSLKEGEVILQGRDRKRFPEFYAEYDKTQIFVGRMDNWVCESPIKYVGHDAIRRDIDNLKNAMKRAGVTKGFLPVVAPASVVPFHKEEYYSNDEEFVFAVAEALSVEYKAIVDAGLSVQIDDALLAYWYELTVPPSDLKEYRRWVAVRVDALNHALKQIPPEASRYHLCWGSWNAPHTADVPLKDIVDLVLKINVGAYLFEAANPRHEHEWKIWREVKLPDGKKLAPGVISHATNVVEHPELVADRLERYADLVGRENVIASTDCGFAQGPLTRRVHPTVMWAKLRALSEGARLASDRLWQH